MPKTKSQLLAAMARKVERNKLTHAPLKARAHVRTTRQDLAEKLHVKLYGAGDTFSKTSAIERRMDVVRRDKNTDLYAYSGA